MKASLTFEQVFNGISTPSNPISSTVDVSGIKNTIVSNIQSQLTEDVKPAGSSSFYTVTSDITSQGFYFKSL